MEREQSMRRIELPLGCRCRLEHQHDDCPESVREQYSPAFQGSRVRTPSTAKTLRPEHRSSWRARNPEFASLLPDQRGNLLV